MPEPLDRRRSPRVAAANHPELPRGIVDVGLGGLSVKFREPLAPDSVHDVSVTLGSGSEIVFRVRVAYSRRESRPDGGPVFVTGLAFLADVTDQASREPLRLAS